MAEGLGSALQKLLQQFESARYLQSRFANSVAGFFMLTPEEEKFIAYWGGQRLQKKAFLRKLSFGLPLFAVLCIVFFASIVSGWYGKADKELRQHSSLVMVIIVALVGIGVFMAIFSAHHRWDLNESDYQSLLRKKDAAPSLET